MNIYTRMVNIYARDKRDLVLDLFISRNREMFLGPRVETSRGLGSGRDQDMEFNEEESLEELSSDKLSDEEVRSDTYSR